MAVSSRFVRLVLALAASTFGGHGYHEFNASAFHSVDPHFRIHVATRTFRVGNVEVHPAPGYIAPRHLQALRTQIQRYPLRCLHELLELNGIIVGSRLSRTTGRQLLGASFRGTRQGDDPWVAIDARLFEEPERTCHVVQHEMGHILPLSPEFGARWTELHAASLGLGTDADGTRTGFVSDYAATSRIEDLAESYAYLLCSPVASQSLREHLDAYSRRKIEALEAHVRAWCPGLLGQ